MTVYVDDFRFPARVGGIRGAARQAQTTEGGNR
jgi:hypothetical protein